MLVVPTQDLGLEYTHRLSDHDLEYMSTWLCRAFSKGIFIRYLLDSTLEHAPERWQLFFKAMLQRGGVCGQIQTTKDRNACRIIFKPGDRDRLFDTSWRSGRDGEWDEMLASIGQTRWDETINKLNAQMKPLIRATYGEDDTHLWRSLLFGVNPACQKQGYGKALAQHTLADVRADGGKWYFISPPHNLDYYKSIGCTDRGSFALPDGRGGGHSGPQTQIRIHIVDIG